MRRVILVWSCLLVAVTHAGCGSTSEDDDASAKRSRPNNAAGTSANAVAGAAGSGAGAPPDVTGFGGSVASGGTTSGGGAGASPGNAGTSSVGGTSSSAGGSSSSAGGATASGGAATSGGSGGTAGKPSNTCDGAFACTAPIPAGFRLATAPATATGGTVCAGGERLGLTPGGPLSCSACACAGVAASCAATDIRIFTGAGAAECQGAGQAIDPSGPSCGEYSVAAGSNIHGRFSLTAPAATCTAGGGTETARPPAFGDAVDLCPTALADSGCAGAVCAAPSAPLCVVADGDVACPSGWAAKRSVAFRTPADTRACAPCNCDAEATCPSATIAVLQSPACQSDFGPFFRFSSSGGCQSMPAPSGGTEMHHMMLDPSPATVSCTPKGGGSVGAVSLTQPVTICCR